MKIQNEQQNEFIQKSWYINDFGSDFCVESIFGAYNMFTCRQNHVQTQHGSTNREFHAFLLQYLWFACHGKRSSRRIFCCNVDNFRLRNIVFIICLLRAINIQYEKQMHSKTILSKMPDT